MMIHKIRSTHVIRKLAVRHRFCLQTGIYTGLVKGQWIKRSKHTDIRQNRHIIFSMAVAVRRNINNQRNMEIRSSVNNRLRIFCHLAVQNSISIAISECNGIKITCAEASAATYAMFCIYSHFLCFCIEYESAVGTFLLTALAAYTFA